MNKIRRAILIVMGLAVAAAPLPGALTPAQQQYIIEKSKLENLKRLAYQADPRLKWIEGQTAALQARMKKKQEATREAIDKYLAEHKLTHQDLAKYRLDAITDLLMRINPYTAVNDPLLKEIAMGALRKAPPVNPAEFANKFPGKKPAEVPAEALLDYHKTQLKAEAGKARAKLAPLIREAGTPAFMVEAMNEITAMKCTLTLCRAYVDAATPAELKAQQARVAAMERQPAK